MLHFLSVRRVFVQFFVVATLMLPVVCKAQVGFIIDEMMSGLCIIQNWDTPNMQGRLKQMPRAGRMQMFGSLQLSSVTKRCLMKRKAVAVDLCAKVIANFVGFRQGHPVGGGMPFQNLTQKEEHQIWEGFQGSGCKLDDYSEGATDWVPDDIRASDATIKLLERAKKGDVTAQFDAYKLYKKGIEVPENETLANYWLSSAANGGNVNAQYDLGWEYSIGTSSHQMDSNQAIRFLTLAANQGNRDAMRILGYVYGGGNQVVTEGGATAQMNMQKAMDWYTKAANLGDSYAAAELANIYGAGKGNTADAGKMFFWYAESARNLNAQSMLKLSWLYQTGKGTARDVKLAQQWRRRADALGVNGRGLYLKDYFPWGESPKNAVLTAKIQLDHAKAGDVDAQIAIASRYTNGEGVAKDEKTARMWWQRIALAGDPIAQRMWGKYLMNDKDSGNQDHRRAGIDWLQKAMAQGDVEAQVRLAYWHAGREWKGAAERKQQTLEGVRLMLDAAERGYKPADTTHMAEIWKESLTNE